MFGVSCAQEEGQERADVREKEGVREKKFVVVCRPAARVASERNGMVGRSVGLDDEISGSKDRANVNGTLSVR